MHIQDGLNRLGELYHQSGDLANSLKSYVRSRDYCSNSEQLLEMCFRVIQVIIMDINDNNNNNNNNKILTMISLGEYRSRKLYSCE